MTIASTRQMRLLHVVAKTAGENHDHIRGRAARLWGLESLEDLTMDQARQLIEVYNDIINPPEPPASMVSGRGAFAGLPKFHNKKPAPAPSKPAKLQCAQIATETEPRSLSPSGSKPELTVPKPTWHLKKAAHNFDPNLKIQRGGVEEIPW